MALCDIFCLPNGSDGSWAYCSAQDISKIEVITGQVQMEKGGRAKAGRPSGTQLQFHLFPEALPSFLAPPAVSSHEAVQWGWGLLHDF